MISAKPLRKSVSGKYPAFSLSCLLGSALLCCSPLYAQSGPQPQRAPLPAGVPTLPEPREKEQVKLLSKNNLPSFEALLIEPLKDWVKEGKVVLRLVSGLNYAWSYGEEFEAESRRNVSRYSLSPDGSLQFSAGLGQIAVPSDSTKAENQEGDRAEEQSETVNSTTAQAKKELSYPLAFPFGLAADLEAESSPQLRAQKVIWNSAISQTRLAEGRENNSPRFERTAYQFALSWFTDSAMIRSAKGVFYRRAPGPFAWREDALRFYSPSILAGHSFLSSRSLDAVEDRFFIFSAVSKKSRPALATNRGDGILGAGITFDELFGLAIKPQTVSARLIDQQVLLLPFPALNPWQWSVDINKPSFSQSASSSAMPPAAQTNEKYAPVFSIAGELDAQDSSSGKKPLVTWNYQTQQLPQFTPWLPTSVFFVPRKVWLLEVAPLDPYYANGKELVFVDQESMLPFYKIIFDRLGEHRRTVVCAWNLARLKDGSFARAVPAFVMSVEANAEKAQVLQVEKTQMFYARGGKYLGAQNPAVKDFDANFNADKYKLPERKAVGQKAAVSNAPEEDLRD